MSSPAWNRRRRITRARMRARRAGLDPRRIVVAEVYLDRVREFAPGGIIGASRWYSTADGFIGLQSGFRDLKAALEPLPDYLTAFATFLKENA